MSNKKGFVLIETIVTVLVLAVSLLYIYSAFNDVLFKEKTRVRYNDVGHMYHTFYIKEFFSEYNLNSILSHLNINNPMAIIGCDHADIFIDSVDVAASQSKCNAIIESLGVTRIAVSLGDLSYVHDCNDSTDAKCSYLYNFTDEELSYLQTLGDLGEDNKYVMIVEFSEEKIFGNSDVDTSKIHNTYNYAWVRI